MTVIGLDDTDSRDAGMCTTYVAATIAARIRESAAVDRLLLVRLNPAVEHKTRGNAALAVHTDLGVEAATTVAREEIEAAAETGDENTHPGLVVAPGEPDEVPPPIAAFSHAAIREHLTVDRARELVTGAGYTNEEWKNGRGLVGALAAVGAWCAFDPASPPPGSESPGSESPGSESPGSESPGSESPASSSLDAGDSLADWTYEVISYREPERWGTPRDVDRVSVFAAADEGYPTVWDTVDRGEDEVVCVPHTPGPVLHGIRGDDPATCRAVAAAIEGEPVDRRETFVTNQGTDAHLQGASLADVEDGHAYRVDGTVSTEPATREGGHVFFELRDWHAGLQCVAFEPTKRFRDRVRGLRAGDEITACGEVSEGTLKLEKFAVRDAVSTEDIPPTCPGCERRMKSAGRGQGYRCRDCRTSAEETVERELDRDLERGWYEVPPCARRHVAKPLVRGGFDAPTHPET